MNTPAASSDSRTALSSWAATVGTAIVLQWLVILVLALIAWIWAGSGGALSLIYGGAAVALPNAVFALWLTLRMLRGFTSGVVALMAGELFKLGCTIALLVAVVTKVKTGLSWPALLIGVIGALKAQWLALWVTRRY